jgi:hypothetical protein
MAMTTFLENLIDVAVVLSVGYVFYAASTEPLEPPLVSAPLPSLSAPTDHDRAARPEPSRSSPTANAAMQKAACAFPTSSCSP